MWSATGVTEPTALPCSFFTYPECGKVTQKQGTGWVSCGLWCLLGASLRIFWRAFEIYVTKNVLYSTVKGGLCKSLGEKKKKELTCQRGKGWWYDLSLKSSVAGSAWDSGWGSREGRTEGEVTASHFPGKSWAKRQGEGGVSQSERVGRGEKGETKLTSWKTGRGGCPLKDREIGSWKKEACEELVICFQSIANLPSLRAMGLPHRCKILSVLWDVGTGTGLSTQAKIPFGRGHSPPKSYSSLVGFLRKRKA